LNVHDSKVSEINVKAFGWLFTCGLALQHWQMNDGAVHMVHARSVLLCGRRLCIPYAQQIHTVEIHDPFHA
jgi:hypothetical protein